jgi:hypothetical protein
MPGIRYGIDGRGDCGVPYVHGMDNCNIHLDICIYPGEKSGERYKLKEVACWYRGDAVEERIKPSECVLGLGTDTTIRAISLI